ncbi:MAG: bifunctional glutamate N-acetyltransferase/amino-acid acetyltransferase ArgJ [Myxococcota bacterium]|nr:bifunctional glutamate N-acetyltransferase/amino-acid acetyltransferase ArgJ [Myxococcota bacterium]
MKPGEGELVVPGFRAAGIHCGIKARTRDLALVVSDAPATIAGVFTQSTVVGAPVPWSRERVRRGTARALVVNSGISNVAMGARGRRDNRTLAGWVARHVGCPVGQVVTGATGVIGEPLPMAKLRAGIPRAHAALRPRGLAAAAQAIRTTDTFAKTAVRRVRLGGELVTVAGIAKGSGMIEPKMATMLAYVFTDAAIAAAPLQGLVRSAADASFNRLSIDGETSTSDCFVAFAGGMAGNPMLRTVASTDARRLAGALNEVCESLVRDLARDGEGATKLVTIDVRRAASPAEAEIAARRIANSALVKTALFGQDPNWGRILQTVGAGRVSLRESRAVVKLGGVAVFEHGASTGSAARRRADLRMAEPEITIEVDLAAGRAATRMWTCDFSYDYVRINAEYTT